MSRVIKTIQRRCVAVETHTARPGHHGDLYRSAAPPVGATAKTETVQTGWGSSQAQARHLDEGGLAFLGLDSRALAACRTTALKLESQLDLASPRSVCLTTSMVGEGNCAAAVQLAFVLAGTQRRRVVVVDANFESPRFSQLLEAQPHIGLSEVLVQGLFPSEAIYEVEPAGYDILPAGQPDARAEKLLNGPRMTAVLEELKRFYDLIVVDAPPLSSEGRVPLFAKCCDATYLVMPTPAKPERTELLISRLRRNGISLTGCIHTRAGAVCDVEHLSARSSSEQRRRSGHSGLTRDRDRPVAAAGYDSPRDATDVASQPVSPSRVCLTPTSAGSTPATCSLARTADDGEPHARRDAGALCAPDTASAIDLVPDPRTSDAPREVGSAVRVSSTQRDPGTLAVWARVKVRCDPPASAAPATSPPQDDSWAENVMLACGILLIIVDVLCLGPDVLACF